MLKIILLSISIVALFYLPVVAQKRGQERIDSLSKRIQQMEDDSNKIAAIYTLSNEYITQGNYGDALKIADDGADLSAKCRYEQGIGRAWMFRAFIREQVGDNPGALECYYKALDRFQRCGFSTGIGRAQSSIAGYYHVQGNFKKAAELLQSAQQIFFKDLGITDTSKAVQHLSTIPLTADNRRKIEVLASSYIDMSGVASTQHLNKVQINYCLTAARYFTILHDTANLAVCMINIGNGYFNEKEYPLSLHYLHFARDLSRKIGDRSFEASSNHNIGGTLRSLRKYDEAIRYFNLAISFYQQSSASTYLEDLYNELTIIDSIRGNWKSAFAHRSLRDYHRAVNDKTRNAEAVMQTQMRYEFSKKQEADSLQQLKNATIAREDLQRQTLMRNGFIAGFSVMVFFTVVFLRQRNNIKKGKEQSDALLLNILPHEVAEELKIKGTASAKHFDNVTVLFTDFKAFTTVSQQLSPQELVDELHACFKGFDEICTKYSIEKIKTIGDAYLAVCGLPLPDEKHAENVVKAALEIREFMANRSKELGAKTFEIRIGINSGSVVAGIVGVKKFAYDIWGDTVNTAARMEQNSEAGKINISESTYAIVKDRFSCEYRGEIDAKNKGKLKMYFVETL
ncbi:MAG: tetratricopeptide repeat protein [Ignavibacteria bacterium]|nr:tetratricopeptide repeat protein [Ignavibacteria bacterium]